MTHSITITIEYRLGGEQDHRLYEGEVRTEITPVLEAYFEREYSRYPLEYLNVREVKP